MVNLGFYFMGYFKSHGQRICGVNCHPSTANCKPIKDAAVAAAAEGLPEVPGGTAAVRVGRAMPC
jgi:hypothetical protein